MADNVATGPAGPVPTGPPGPLAGQPQEVTDFLGLLSAIDIEQQISVDEAMQAVVLFSVVNVLLAGKGRAPVENKVDFLAVLALNYSSQSADLSVRSTVAKEFWNARVDALGQSVEDALRDLKDRLDRLAGDAAFMEKEGKRQFNLGPSNDVVGNVEFPRLFRRYVDIVTDPLLAMNIDVEDHNPTSDKEQVARSIDLLVELKSVLLQLVRSLSRYGTLASRQHNKDWAEFERRALLLLKLIADQYRQSDDIDDKHPYAVLADLTGKQRDTEIAPYIVLAREGGKLLQLALQTYDGTKNELERVDKSHILSLFQGTDPAAFMTERMRREASVVKKYPLQAWN
jgi:hypothetical protein